MDQAYLFNTGKNYMSYNILGSRPETNSQGESGYRFAVWAPNAVKVCVVGDFNEWEIEQNFLEAYGTTGIWIGFIPDLKLWDKYKYAILNCENEWVFKADPYARHAETRPGTASILYDPDDFTWTDQAYMDQRVDAYDLKPLNVYEVHLGSWRSYEDGSVYNYRDIAEQLADYVLDMGFNAIELMPITEYPLDTSWGYQVTGYFAPTSRYGTPADLKYFINHMHNKGIHVFLDWVPAHFPKDKFALARFDGTALYEYEDPLLAENPDWGTLVFDYGKPEVRSFLLSSAYFWLSEFHFDGLRVDAVSYMLYRDYGRKEYLLNETGGRENLEAISFLRELNSIIRQDFPGVITMAEEATSFPYITKSVDRGGIGFTFKWNMGWMNDTLFYNSLDHYQREFHQNSFTFSMMYAFSERYILPFSHDEVVHGKGTLIGRMPGDYWRKFANLRTVFAYQIAHPGAKFNFMGNEYAPFTEWRYYQELEWFMLEYPAHKQMHDFVRDLNHFYLETPALWENDHDWDGFQWVQTGDNENCIFSFLRFNEKCDQAILCVLNMTPAVLADYTLELPISGDFHLVLNSDNGKYGGSDYLNGFGNKKTYRSYQAKFSIKEDVEENYLKSNAKGSKDKTDHKKEAKSQTNNLDIIIPPLCALYYKWDKDEVEEI